MRRIDVIRLLRFRQTREGELLEFVIGAVLFISLFHAFIARPSQTNGVSMAPTMLGVREPSLRHTFEFVDRVVIEKLSIRFRNIRRGDIVTVRHLEKGYTFIKRVIGVAGDTVLVQNGQVFVNGVALRETYIQHHGQYSGGPFSVPPGFVFLMGDNRPQSYDSRKFGNVPVRYIEGRACFTYWPPSRIGWIR